MATRGGTAACVQFWSWVEVAYLATGPCCDFRSRVMVALSSAWREPRTFVSAHRLFGSVPDRVVARLSCRTASISNSPPAYWTMRVAVWIACRCRCRCLRLRMSATRGPGDMHSPPHFAARPHYPAPPTDPLSLPILGSRTSKTPAPRRAHLMPTGRHSLEQPHSATTHPQSTARPTQRLHWVLG